MAPVALPAVNVPRPPADAASPASTWCQRWQGGQHSWRRASDGGFDASRYRVVPIPESVARPFVSRHHYAASYPAARQAYGLVSDDPAVVVDGAQVDGWALVGVAVLSVPMRASVLSNVFPDLAPYTETLELGRLVLTDTPANAESWFLARAFAAAAETGLRGVVSFADPMPRSREVVDVVDGEVCSRVEQITPGHCGLIYQALNAVACGRSTARTLTYLPRSGSVLSDRTLSKIRGRESGADAAERHLVALGARVRREGQEPAAWLRAALGEIGAVKVRHPGNFRYAWPLGTPAQRRGVRVGLPVTDYPKPATDLLPLP